MKPSKQALARRQKFVEAKKKAGGYAELREESKNLPVLIYFNDAGDIMGISKTPILDKEWKHYAFTTDQASVLDNKHSSQYKITQDLNESLVYYLEAKPEEIYVRSETDELSLITKSKAKDYDIKVEIRDNVLMITMHLSMIENYKDIAADYVHRKGKKELTFYITAIGDPHFLFKQVSVGLCDLLKNKTVQIVLPEYDYSQVDIYTIRLFNNYIRNESINARISKPQTGKIVSNKKASYYGKD